MTGRLELFVSGLVYMSASLAETDVLFSVINFDELSHKRPKSDRHNVIMTIMTC